MPATSRSSYRPGSCRRVCSKGTSRRRSSTTASCSSPRRRHQVIAIDAKTGDSSGAISVSCRETAPAPSDQSRRRAVETRSSCRRWIAFSWRSKAETGKVLWESAVIDYKGLLHDPGAAGREGQGHGRRLGWRIRHSRLRRGARRARPAKELWRRPTPSQVPASPATRPGRATPGRPAARRSGSRQLRPGPASPIGALAMPRLGCRTCVRATISTPPPHLDRRDTGKIKGHHQYQKTTPWDWDEVSAPLLVDLGRTVASGPGPGPCRPRRLPVGR